ncbi:hypothetical protein L3K78_13825 [Oscillospiraceae bacterium SCCA1]|nr:hypothetical protein [Oscillospiraceae bacterium SCCA1]
MAVCLTGQHTLWQERFFHRISEQGRKGLDFMMQTAIMLSKQASKQASKQDKLCPESVLFAISSFA